MSAQAIAKKDDGETDVGDLIPVSGCCCFFGALYCPDQCTKMIGCFGQGTCLCFEEEFICCKPAEREGDCCICQKVSCIIITPRTCVSGKAQVFCVENRCALPCTEDIPCIVSYLGLTCCLDWACNVGCCKKIRDLRPQQVQ